MESHHQDFFTDLHLAFPKEDQNFLLDSAPAKEELSVDHLLKNCLLPEKLTGDNRYQVPKLIPIHHRVAFALHFNHLSFSVINAEN